jgi:hypothetical protein
MKTVGRVTALVLLLVAIMGPWFYDTHPSTQESCSAPLVWLGNGHCACLVSLVVVFGESFRPGQVLCLLLALPFLSTLLLLIGKQRWTLWVFHLTAWGLAAAFTLFLFVGSWYSNNALRLWGAGLCGVVAAAMLVGEILAAKSRSD